MPPEFIAYLESIGFTDTSVISPEQLKKLETEWQRVAKLTAPPTIEHKTLDEVLAARRAEETRQQRIATLAADALRDYPGAAAQIEAVARLAAADPTWTDAKLELEILRSVRPQAGQFRPSARGVPEGEVLEAALALASKLPNIDKHYRPEILDQVDRTGLRSIGMGQALLMAAAANGMTTRPGETVNRGNVADALAYAFPPRHARLSGGFSTISLPNILSNLANKQSLEGFKETDQSWRLIARIRNARNLQKQTDHRLGGNNKLLPLGKGGQISHGNLNEDTYERQISTKARQLAVTRQAIVSNTTARFS